MREWFIVGSKLLGLYFLFTVISSMLNSIGLFFSLLTSSNSFPPESRTAVLLLITALTMIAEIGCALLLLFKSEWIADKLKLSTSNYSSAPLFRNEILQPGIILIGIFVFATRFGWMAKVFFSNRSLERMNSPFTATQPEGMTFSRDLIDPSVTIIISLCLIFGSKYIASFVTKGKQTKTD